jgi:hypothetical protein
MAANCTGTNAQYADDPTCLAICALVPPGSEIGATADNTLGCRIYHAGAAAGEPDLHCTHAGPLGAGQCGENCESFCALNLAICTGTDEIWADHTTCQTDCEAFDDADPLVFDPSDDSGLDCRMYHLENAVSAPADHCGHTATDGGGFCL